MRRAKNDPVTTRHVGKNSSQESHHSRCVSRIVALLARHYDQGDENHRTQPPSPPPAEQDADTNAVHPKHRLERRRALVTLSKIAR